MRIWDVLLLVVVRIFFLFVFFFDPAIESLVSSKVNGRPLHFRVLRLDFGEKVTVNYNANRTTR